MSRLALSRVAEVVDGQLSGPDGLFSAVSTDSRGLTGGELFVALRGERFDAHSFLAQARDSGAIGALVSARTPGDWPQILVPDTRIALGRLASFWRAEFGSRLIAVTGSNGKTTVKEMLRLVLGAKGPVLATRGNLNNDIGVPLTLLRLQGEPYAVVEMGANHPGEIRYLSRMARPDIVVLNNVGAAHLEGFGDRAGVARAKGEIVEGLGPDGVVVLNADDEWAPLWRELAKKRRVIGFGVKRPADVTVVPGSVKIRWLETGFRTSFVLDSWIGRLPIDLALAGQHNIMNALAAASVGLAEGIALADVQHGLAQIEAVPGRLQSSVAASGAHLVDDTYNANPDSVAAAIAVLSSAPGERWLVLGDLAELGPESGALHAQLGAQARASGVDRLCSVGHASAAATEAFGKGASHFDTQEALVADIYPQLGPDSYVLVKGSRSSAMERVVQRLLGGRAA